MKRRMIELVCSALAMGVFALAASAADLSGVWTGTAKGREGKVQEVTLTLKSSADTFTGTMAMTMGELPVENVKLNGSDISFDVVLSYQGQTKKLNYFGKIDGNQMTLQLSRDGQVQPGGATLTKKQ